MRKRIAGCAAAMLLCTCLIGGSPALAVELQQTSGTTDKILSSNELSSIHYNRVNSILDFERKKSETFLDKIQ